MSMSQGTFEIPSFNGNNYKINNDVLLTIPKPDNKILTKVELNVRSYLFNLTNIIYYSNNNVIRINLSPLIKVVMGDPIFDNNYTNLDGIPIFGNDVLVNLYIKRYYTAINSNEELYDTCMLDRNFIRAGERSNRNNLVIEPFKSLRVTEKIPYWEGLPFADYSINQLGQIIKNNRISEIINKERMISDDCETYYVEFLNQNGGYSYWLFRSAKNSRSTTNQGYSNIYGQVKNFGNEENITHEFISKVPARYMPLMYDLAVSPKVRIFNGGYSWTEIIQRGNTLPYATDKRVYDVSFKFEIPTNFNPKPTW